MFYPQHLCKQFKPSNQDTVGVFGNQQIRCGSDETFITGFEARRGLVGGGNFFYLPKILLTCGQKAGWGTLGRTQLRIRMLQTDAACPT